MTSSDDTLDVKLPEANDRNVSVPFPGAQNASFIELHHDTNNIVNRENERRSTGNYTRGIISYDAAVGTIYRFDDIFRDQPLQDIDTSKSPIAQALYGETDWKSQRKNQIKDHASKIYRVERDVKRFAEDVTHAYQNGDVNARLRPVQIATTGALACLAKKQADSYKIDKAYLEQTEDEITQVGAETLVYRLGEIAETLNNCYKSMTMFAPETDSHLPTTSAKQPRKPSESYTQDMNPEERRFEALQGMIRDPLKEYNQFF